MVEEMLLFIEQLQKPLLNYEVCNIYTPKVSIVIIKIKPSNHDKCKNQALKFLLM